MHPQVLIEDGDLCVRIMFLDEEGTLNRFSTTEV
jgi:hypothetical protein